MVTCTHRYCPFLSGQDEALATFVAVSSCMQTLEELDQNVVVTMKEEWDDDVLKGLVLDLFERLGLEKVGTVSLLCLSVPLLDIAVKYLQYHCVA